MRNSENFWDGAAKKYAKSPIKNMPAYTRTMDRCKFHLSPSDTVLEIGCGTGSTALLLAGSVGQITASDISANMIEIARSKAKDQGAQNVTFVKTGVLDAGFEDGSFDAVLAFSLLHLLEDAPGAIAKAGALLKPGGLFISKTVCMKGQGWIWQLVLPVMQIIGLAPYVNFLTKDELEGMFTSAGFEIIETEDYPATPPSRFIVARKT